jgi:superfamily II DNA or RNA helicase
MGKTIVFAAIAKRRFPFRTMILAHRQELVWQARDKIREFTGLSVEVEMGEHKSSGKNGLFKRATVIVSTIQTHTAGGDGGGRMGKFNPMDFGMLVIDEAHHATSPSYRRVIDYYRTNPALKVLGVTATPDRADEEALGQVFETVAFDYEILNAIRDGWLVPVEQQMVYVDGLDFGAVRTTAGDLNGADLAAIMESEKALHGVAGPSIEIIGQRRAIVFTSSVEHARQLSEIFNRHRTGMAAWVCGGTDQDDRARILSEFKRGKIQVVCNCAVLTEGFDDPGVEVIIMARPTESRALYAQMVGRSTRPLPGVVDGPVTMMARRLAIAKSAKPCCLVVDFVGNSGKHKLMTTADILGGNVSDEAQESAIIKARQSGKPVRMDTSLQEEQELAEEREQRRLESEARRARLTVKAKYKSQSVDPFDLLQLRPVKSRGWDKGKVFSEKQAAMLRRNGVDPNAVDYARGKQLLNAIGERIENHLCSIGQMKVLQKYGVDTNVTFEHAHRIIDAIAANGWHKPAHLPEPLPTQPAREKVESANIPRTTPLSGPVSISDDNVPF